VQAARPDPAAGAAQAARPGPAAEPASGSRAAGEPDRAANVPAAQRPPDDALEPSDAARPTKADAKRPPVDGAAPEASGTAGRPGTEPAPAVGSGTTNGVPTSAEAARSHPVDDAAQAASFGAGQKSPADPPDRPAVDQRSAALAPPPRDRAGADGGQGAPEERDSHRRAPAAHAGDERVRDDRTADTAEPGNDRRVPAQPDDRATGGRPAEPDRADPQQAAEPPQRPAALDAAAVRRVWSEILAAAKQRSRSTGALMVNATVRAVDGDVLVLAIGSEPLARRLSEQRNTDVIADALHAVLGVRWRVRCDHGDAAPPPARPAAPRSAPPPQRPARPAPARPAPARRSAPDDGVPLPPEPPDEDAPPDDEEAMMAEAAADTAAPAARRDPEEVAIELLSAQLGATAIERR
jgi:DNA polymerase-3 subunit gamma/tau